jgi:hypothetical protein
VNRRTFVADHLEPVAVMRDFVHPAGREAIERIDAGEAFWPALPRADRARDRGLAFPTCKGLGFCSCFSRKAIRHNPLEPHGPIAVGAPRRVD